MGRIRRCAVIGSRETPDDVVRLLTQFTSILIEIGYCIGSGGCPLGPDLAATRAIMRHKTTDRSKHRIYISWDGMEGMTHDPSNGIYCPQDHFDNYNVATIMAQLARGSFEGLGKKGKGHHCRNPYQVMWDNLATPVDMVVCWAPKKGQGGFVRGGTATAVRIAIEHGIPVYNLIDPDVLERVEYFVRSVLLQIREKEIERA